MEIKIKKFFFKIEKKKKSTLSALPYQGGQNEYPGRAKWILIRKRILIKTIVAKIWTTSRIWRTGFMCPLLAGPTLYPIFSRRVNIFFFAYCAQVRCHRFSQGFFCLSLSFDTGWTWSIDWSFSFCSCSIFFLFRFRFARLVVL